MKKLLGALVALVLGVGGAVVGIAAPAFATHPQVSGVGTCNTDTGEWTIDWTVTSDPGYDATGVFVSADRVSGQIVGQAVAGNGAAITPHPTEVVASNATVTLTVGIQFSNHNDGDIVYNSGSAYFNARSCEKTKLPPSGNVAWTDTQCVSDGVASGNSATLTLGEGSTATYSIDGVDQGAVAAGTYNDLPQGAYLVTITGENGQTLTYDHNFGPPKTNEECRPTPPEPIFTQNTIPGETVCIEGGGEGSYVNTTYYYQSDPVWNDETKAWEYGEAYLINTTEETVKVGSEACPFYITPDGPGFTEQCGPGYTLTVPGEAVTIEGSTYYETDHGYYTVTNTLVDGAGTIEVIFHPDSDVILQDGEGYTIDEEGNAHWVYSVTNVACNVIEQLAQTDFTRLLTPSDVLGLGFGLIMLGGIAFLVLYLRRSATNKG